MWASGPTSVHGISHMYQHDKAHVLLIMCSDRNIKKHLPFRKRSYTADMLRYCIENESSVIHTADRLWFYCLNSTLVAFLTHFIMFSSFPVCSKQMDVSLG